MYHFQSSPYLQRAYVCSRKAWNSVGIQTETRLTGKPLKFQRGCSDALSRQASLLTGQRARARLSSSSQESENINTAGSRGKHATDLFTQAAAQKAAVAPGVPPQTRSNARSVKSISRALLKAQHFIPEFPGCCQGRRLNSLQPL